MILRIFFKLKASWRMLKIRMCTSSKLIRTRNMFRLVRKRQKRKSRRNRPQSSLVLRKQQLRRKTESRFAGLAVAQVAPDFLSVIFLGRINKDFPTKNCRGIENKWKLFSFFVSLHDWLLIKICFALTLTGYFRFFISPFLVKILITKR